MFIVKDVDLAGRIGLIKLRRGSIETPVFFPVIDPVRQEVSIDEIGDIGFKQVITNAYLIMKRFGSKAVEYGIHKLLGFNGIIMTDSGGYQILEYGDIEYTQRDIIEYQKSIGSDIAVILDVPTGDVGYEKARESVEITLSRAREALNYIVDSEALWVLPIQGGKYLDLVEYSAREAQKLEYYKMYSIGSPTVFLEKYEFRIVLDMIHTAKKVLPQGRPVHLFGAGHPLIITLAIALGIDSFDSASYLLYARDSRYMTEYGVYSLEDLDYLPCNCPICSKLDIKDLKEASRDEKTRLLALHNLYVIKKSIERAKQAIREGRLWELVEELSRRHVKAYEAFRRFRKYYKYLELYTPRVKGEVYGLKFYDIESIWNPKVLRFRSKVLTLLDDIISYGKNIVLKPLVAELECPGDNGSNIIVYYTPFLGLIPSSLCGVYPTTQHSAPKNVSPSIVDDLVYSLRVLAAKARVKGLNIIVEYCSDVLWQYVVALEARDLGLHITMRC
ncbi:MAG: tRNA guanosine(15) transglycosylase TgtA [Acidilobaceae archaeon]